jgi:hypothetical protein
MLRVYIDVFILKSNLLLVRTTVAKIVFMAKDHVYGMVSRSHGTAISIVEWSSHAMAQRVHVSLLS